MQRTLLWIAVLGGLSVAPSLLSGQAARRPSFEGIWNSGTATPLERPKELQDKPFFTRAEADEWERQAARRNEEPSPAAAAKSKGTGTYNAFFREWGTRTVKTLRTSIVTDPPDGRIPGLTAAAAEIKPSASRAACGASRMPRISGFRIAVWHFSRRARRCCRIRTTATTRSFRPKDTVVIHAEMIHDTRIVSSGWPFASAAQREAVAWRFDRPLGRGHARRRYDEFS